VDFNNDLRKEKNAPFQDLKVKISKNRQILKKAFEYLAKIKQDYINIGTLEYDGYDRNCYSRRVVNTKTGGDVYVNIDYGLEGIPGKEYFQIHQLNT
jgi:Txe/YoeB family toxin of Txe-Axe toxin-antitoxin module